MSYSKTFLWPSVKLFYVIFLKNVFLINIVKSEGTALESGHWTEALGGLLERKGYEVVAICG